MGRSDGLGDPHVGSTRPLGHPLPARPRVRWVTTRQAPYRAIDERLVFER